MKRFACDALITIRDLSFPCGGFGTTKMKSITNSSGECAIMAMLQ